MTAINNAEDFSLEEWDDIVRERLTERQAMNGLQELQAAYHEVVDSWNFSEDASAALKSMEVLLIRQNTNHAGGATGNGSPAGGPAGNGSPAEVEGPFWGEALFRTTQVLRQILEVPGEIAALYSVAAIAHRSPGNSSCSMTCSSGKCEKVCC